MSDTVTIDGAGRVVLPKAVRDELRLGAGDILALESDGERVTLRPVRSRARVRKENGIWVLRTGRKVPAEETDRALRDSRLSRDRSLRGEQT